MPYASDAQRKFFNANRQRLEKKGVNVGEWNASSEGMNLPTVASEENHRQSTIRKFKESTNKRKLR